MTEGKKRSNKKCLAYVAVLIIFQAAVILVFALTVMKIKSPKVRFGSITVDNLSSSNTTPSFSMKWNTQFTIKNTNFGHFKYENSTVTIYYNASVVIGKADIAEGRVRARQTKRFDITFDINSGNLAGDSLLRDDINYGILTLTSQAKLRGKVHLMKVIKKKKTAPMVCTMSITLATKAVTFLDCDMDV